MYTNFTHEPGGDFSNLKKKGKENLECRVKKKANFPPPLQMCEIRPRLGGVNTLLGRWRTGESFKKIMKVAHLFTDIISS